MDLTGRHYTWFQNRDCEYFPCHNDVAQEDFNCLFSYRPLARATHRGGSIVTVNGVNDSSYCLLPHNDESYAYIAAKLREEGLFPSTPQE